jgi:adenosine 3'-phospho 5'-phosphosulfate transporter B3
MKSLKIPYSGLATLNTPLLTVCIGAVTGVAWRERKAPWSMYWVVGALGLTSMFTATYSLLFVTYPTQIIIKSSKVLPVMLVGATVFQQLYHPLQYMGALALILGIACFVLADASVGLGTDAWGLAVLAVSLSADAFLGNMQTRLFGVYGASQDEANYFSSVVTTLLLLVGMAVGSPHELMAIPTLDWRAWAGLLVNGLTGWVGMFPILALNQYYGAASTAFWTSLRKAVTVVLSFLMFPKPVSIVHVVGFLLVGGGIWANLRGADLLKQQQNGPSPSSSSSTPSSSSSSSSSSATVADSSSSPSKPASATPADSDGSAPTTDVEAVDLQLPSDTDLHHLQHPDRPPTIPTSGSSPDLQTFGTHHRARTAGKFPI